MDVRVEKNAIEWMIKIGIFLFNVLFMFGLYYAAMAKDLGINAEDFYLQYEMGRYLGIVIGITILGESFGFKWLEEYRSKLVARQYSLRALTKAIKYGSIIIVGMAVIIGLEYLALWYYHIRMVNVELGYTGLRSAIWCLIILSITLVGAAIQDIERRRRVGSRALVKH
jgi:hypothetical protein